MNAENTLLLTKEQIKYLKDTLQEEKLVLAYMLEDPKSEHENTPVWEEELKICNSILDLI